MSWSFQNWFMMLSRSRSRVKHCSRLALLQLWTCQDGAVRTLLVQFIEPARVLLVVLGNYYLSRLCITWDIAVILSCWGKPMSFCVSSSVSLFVRRQLLHISFGFCFPNLRYLHKQSKSLDTPFFYAFYLNLVLFIKQMDTEHNTNMSNICNNAAKKTRGNNFKHTFFDWSGSFSRILNIEDVWVTFYWVIPPDCHVFFIHGFDAYI